MPTNHHGSLAFRAIVAATIFAASGFGCRSRAAAPKRVAASIFPLADLARNVAPSGVEVVELLPPGGSPHTFDPTPREVKALSGARVLFLVGHGIDDWSTGLARGAGVPEIVTVDEGIDLRRRDGAVDPHYWLTAGNGAIIAHTVERSLERLFPESVPEMRRRLETYERELDAAGREVDRTLADLPSRGIATFHDAFEYFAKAYGLEVVAVFEPAPGRSPGPRAVREFQVDARAGGACAVFYEPQLPISVVSPVAEDLGLPLVELDALGGGPGRESFLDTILFDARQIAGATRNCPSAHRPEAR
jgi:ABC-type Zn uptake system ZnuABC Zn-binding protein ZnuA